MSVAEGNLSRSILLSTPPEMVSAFCRAIISSVFPFPLLGEGNAKGHNWKLLMQAVNKFVCARRYESFTLETVLRGMKVKLLLRSPNASLTLKGVKH